MYILARVLHDWTDAKCSHLLQRVYQACRTGRWRGRWAPGPGVHSGQRYRCLDATRARKPRHGDEDSPLRVRRPEFRPASGGCLLFQDITTSRAPSYRLFIATLFRSPPP